MGAHLPLGGGLGVFTTAEGAGWAEASITQAELEAAVSAVAAGRQRRTKQEQAEAVANEFIPASAPWRDYYARWLAENEQLLADSYTRMCRQVVSGLEEFDPRLRLLALTRERLAQYTVWPFAAGKRESTVQRHYTFLRECNRLAGKAVPKWLSKFAVRYGRVPALRRAEVQVLATA